MTTYVLGAGASFHAGYPLCSELWPKMATWVIESPPLDSGFRQAIEIVSALNGPVVDTEAMFTNLDLGQGAFRPLTEDQRNKLRGNIRQCLRSFFKSVSDEGRAAPLYEAFAKKLKKGDVVVTFNYDVSLENELIRAQKFGIRNGYGSSLEGDWDEPNSDVSPMEASIGSV
jgi:hypothetical protein